MTIIATERATVLHLSHAVTIDPAHPVLVRAHARRRPTRRARITEADREYARAYRRDALYARIAALRADFATATAEGRPTGYAGLSLRSACRQLADITGGYPWEYAPEAF